MEGLCRYQEDFKGQQRPQGSAQLPCGKGDDHCEGQGYEGWPCAVEGDNPVDGGAWFDYSQEDIGYGVSVSIPQAGACKY